MIIIKQSSFNPLSILSDKKEYDKWIELTKKHPWGFYIDTKVGRFNCIPNDTFDTSIKINNWNIVYVNSTIKNDDE